MKKKVPPEPKAKTTPLTTNETEKKYEDKQKQYFETAITLNQTNTGTAIENAEDFAFKLPNQIQQKLTDTLS